MKKYIAALILVGLAVVAIAWLTTGGAHAKNVKCPLNFQTCHRLGDGGKGSGGNGPKFGAGVCKVGGCTN